MSWVQMQEFSLGFCILLWELFSDSSEAKIVNSEVELELKKKKKGLGFYLSLGL